MFRCFDIHQESANRGTRKRGACGSHNYPMLRSYAIVSTPRLSGRIPQNVSGDSKMAATRRLRAQRREIASERNGLMPHMRIWRISWGRRPLRPQRGDGRPAWCGAISSSTRRPGPLRVDRLQGGQQWSHAAAPRLFLEPFHCPSAADRLGCSCETCPCAPCRNPQM